MIFLYLSGQNQIQKGDLKIKKNTFETFFLTWDNYKIFFDCISTCLIWYVNYFINYSVLHFFQESWTSISHNHGEKQQSLTKTAKLGKMITSKENKWLNWDNYSVKKSFEIKQKLVQLLNTSGWKRYKNGITDI